jgi:enamine deaminase RidA (YjgF/YER057c/UK114 family)
VSDPPPRLAFVRVPEWPRPKGYENGALVRGPTLFVAGQIGWASDGTFPSSDLVEQFALALDNVLAVVRAAGGTATDVAKLTIHVTDLDAYREGLGRLGPLWRARFGKHFPAMAVIGCAGLVEREAKVEIEAVAVLAERSKPSEPSEP